MNFAIIYMVIRNMHGAMVLRNIHGDKEYTW